MGFKPRANSLATDSLWEALNAEDAKALSVAINQGANLEKARDDQSPLRFAALAEDLKMVRLLLKHGVEVDATDPWERTALLLTDSLPVLRALLSAGADVSAVDWRERSALHAPTDLAMVKVLLKAGAEPNLPSYFGSYPLHSCIDAPIARALIKAGADLGATDEHGDTLLHLHARNDRPELVQFYLAANIPYDSLNDAKESPLHKAAYGSVDCAKLLLNAGCDPTLADDKGMTPLHIAAQHSRRPIARTLVAAGADLDAVNKRGESALHYACQRENKEMIELLLKKGARADLADSEGKTPGQWLPARNKTLRAILKKAKGNVEKQPKAIQVRRSKASLVAQTYLGKVANVLGRVCTMTGKSGTMLPGKQDLYVFDWDKLSKDESEYFTMTYRYSNWFERLEEFVPFALAGHPDDVDNEVAEDETNPFMRLIVMQPPPLLLLEKKTKKVWAESGGMLFDLKSKLPGLRVAKL